MEVTELQDRFKEGSGRRVELEGKIGVKIRKDRSVSLGKSYSRGIIEITRPDLVTEGGNGEIEAEIEDCTTGDWSLFLIRPTARNATFRNLKVRVHIRNPQASTRHFSLFYNTAYGVRFENCRLEVYSDRQLNLYGIFNNGNADTHLETRADNLTVSGSCVRAECRAENYPAECTVYGLYNYLANSISVQDTFVYATNRGDGEGQKAVGLYSNGRFGRFEGNNIKANGCHNLGMAKEQAHAYGMINEGMYSIVTGNNLVGEWGGKCVGLQTSGEYALISSNKILSTHTICGRSVISRGDCSEISGNILTSTSRNARLLEHDARYCILSGNIMEVLMAQSECRSGCGIYAAGGHCEGNLISENIIRQVADCGIYARPEAGVLVNNQVFSYPETVALAGPERKDLYLKLEERNIRSLS